MTFLLNNRFALLQDLLCRHAVEMIVLVDGVHAKLFDDYKLIITFAGKLYFEFCDVIWDRHCKNPNVKLTSRPAFGRSG